MPKTTRSAWPLSDPVADHVLSEFLDRVAPDWPRKGSGVAVSAGELLDLLSGWTPLFEEVVHDLVDVEFTGEADLALFQLALGRPAPFSRLSRPGRAVLYARMAVAVALARDRVINGDAEPVMHLPSGLTESEMRIAVIIRLLLNAPFRTGDTVWTQWGRV